MFCGGNQYALAHEAGGVGNASDVLPGGGEGEIPKVGAEEDDAGTGGGGTDFDIYRNAMVQTNARYGDRAGNRLFKVHAGKFSKYSKNCKQLI